MCNGYGRIEYGWSRCENNIINACNLFSKNFNKIVENLTCSVKLGKIFSSGGERILFVILNNLLGSEEITAIFLL